MRQALISFALITCTALATPNKPLLDSKCKSTASWPGWFGIKHAFIFGDSYSSTGFSPTSSQPSISNPLGNPAYPGITTANGPNWVDFLTVKYNSSLLLTYDFAWVGATVDAALVKPFHPSVRSLRDQILTEFIPKYAQTEWTVANSLFAIFIGINDVEGTFRSGAPATTLLNSKIFAVYKWLVEKLYAAGARNFVFLTVPPVDRAPRTAAEGHSIQALEKADIDAFNHAIISMADEVKRRFQACNVFVVGTNRLFSKVLNKPSTFKQTAGYKNLTAFCSEYEFGTPKEDTFIKKCGVPVNEYFWLDDIHPTYPMHDALAQNVAAVLNGGPNVC